MSQVMLISSDGHATARQEDYLDYLDPEIRTDFKEWLEGTGPASVGINAHPHVDPAVNFDSTSRLDSSSGREACGPVWWGSGADAQVVRANQTGLRD